MPKEYVCIESTLDINTPLGKVRLWMDEESLEDGVHSTQRSDAIHIITDFFKYRSFSEVVTPEQLIRYITEKIEPNAVQLMDVELNFNAITNMFSAVGGVVIYTVGFDQGDVHG